MTGPSIARQRARLVFARARSLRLLVVGDLMLDQFIWGHVRRISPEAPVPVVEFASESFMPGGAANVARNLAELGSQVTLAGVVGADAAGRKLRRLLEAQGVDCTGFIVDRSRPTSLKTRIIAHQQQVVRVDREPATALHLSQCQRLLRGVERQLDGVDAVIVGDYGKGVIHQNVLDGLRAACRERGLWLSLDPKPVHHLDLRGLSLITPNRKEAFELAGRHDSGRTSDPRQDAPLHAVAAELLRTLMPALLLITLGDHGMLLCRRNQPPLHIPTAAQEVFDVSGAGDTVIACFTLAIAAGASPTEAAILANHAAGVVVGKVGTATATAAEVLAGLRGRS